MRLTRGRLALLGATALSLCAWGASGTPRVTLFNSGIRIEHPPARAAWGLAGAAGLALLAAGVAARVPRATLAAVALLAAALALQRLSYRVEAGPQALVARGVLGERSLRWREVSRVDNGPEAVVVHGRGDAEIRIGTGQFPADLRVTLERAISRRVAESRNPGAPP